MESRDGVHEDRPRLRQLLRGPIRRTLARRRRPSAGFRSEAMAGAARRAGTLAQAEADIRQLDERPFPQAGAGGVRGPGVRSHGADIATCLSGIDQAFVPHARLCPSALRRNRSAGPYMARRIDREPRARRTAGAPETNAGSDSFRSSPCSALSVRSTSTASPGRSSEAKAVRERGRWNPNGRESCAINAAAAKPRSSSSSGAARAQSRAEESWTAELGTNFPTRNACGSLIRD